MSETDKAVIGKVVTRVSAVYRAIQWMREHSPNGIPAASSILMEMGEDHLLQAMRELNGLDIVPGAVSMGENS